MSKSNLSVVSLSTYTSPKIIENKRKRWIDYGEDNNYFGYLIDRYNGSPTNNACINGISQMIYGKGVDALDKRTKIEDYASFSSLISDECIERVVNDYKLLGNACMQVSYNLEHTKIIEVSHLPVETIRSGHANEDGDVTEYFYFNDWSKKKPSDLPLEIPAFGTSREQNELLYIKPYKSGFYYYAPVDYQGGIQYAEQEEEISNYHLNNILNGLAPSMMINFRNGIPDDDTRRQIENDIKAKYSGTSNAGKFILNFSDNDTQDATIQPIELSDAHNQYQFLSDESMRKIMVSHRVVSPMLLGIKDNSGLGNNADELKTASILMDNTVIRPTQNKIIDALNKVLAFNNIYLELYFKTLQPLEFTDLENAQSTEQVVEETGVELNKDLTDEEFEDLELNLEGTIISDEWELVDKREYLEDNESIDSWAKRTIKPKQTKLADYIKSAPNDESFLDKSYYKVRYSYEEKYSSGNSRQFCKNMMQRTSKGVVYRKEDIDQASFSGVNNKFGHKGQNYSLFKYKGGVNCGHYFAENLYRLKSKTEKYISKGEIVDSIPSSYAPKGAEYETAKVAPKDMPNNGHHPNYKK